VNGRTVLIPKCFLAEISNAAMHIQIGSFEIVQRLGKLENPGSHRGAHLEWLWIGRIAQLPNVCVSRAILAHGDFNIFRGAAFEDAPEGNRGPTCRSIRGGGRGRTGAWAGRRRSYLREKRQLAQETEDTHPHQGRMAFHFIH
jgi:hypothetical protein